MAKSKKQSAEQESEQASMDLPLEDELNERKKKKKKNATAGKEAKGTEMVPFSTKLSKNGQDKKNAGGSAARHEASSDQENLPVRAGGQAVKESTVPIRIPEQEKRNLWGRLGVLLLIALVMAASVLIFMFRPTGFVEKTGSIRFVYQSETQTTLVLVDGDLRGAEGGYSGEMTFQASSANGKVSAAIIGNRLYTVKGRKVVEMAGDVTDCVLSADGSAVVWRNAASELRYAKVGKPESAKRINARVLSDRYCLSPNGEEVLYTYTDDDNILRINVLSNTGKKPTNMTEDQNFYPVAIADDCDYLYYTDANGALYVFNRQTGARTKCGDCPVDIVFNRDLSQMIFRNADEANPETRMYVKGERFLIVDLGTDRLSLAANRRVSVLPTLLNGSQYMTNSLLKNYYVRTDGVSNKLMYLTREEKQGVMELLSFVDNAEQVTVTDKYVFFIKTSEGVNARTNLYCAKNGKLESELFYNDVKTYCTNVDGSRLLYITSEGLFSCRMGGEHQWLSDYVVNGSLQVTADDAFYFYYEPGKLYVSDNGDGIRSVAEGVDLFIVDGDTLYYVTDLADDGSGTAYANFRNSRKNEQIANGVSHVR